MVRVLHCLLLFAALTTSAAAQQRTDVDLELVLAVDVSLSMDYEELRLQREGYAAALRDPEVHRAIRGGLTGRIAVTYVEWAGFGSTRVLVPWTLVDGPAAANGVAEIIANTPTIRLRRTSISGALLTSLELFDRSPFQARRRVIDISGDGPNNEGPQVVATRDEVLARGIVINGLPVMISRQQSGWFDIENLHEYYEDCVIGGAGAFMIPVTEREAFARAIRTKLILEISGTVPIEPTFVPVQARQPRVPCDVGEQIWRRWNDR